MAALGNMTRKEILGKVYKMVPPMLEKFHKGISFISPFSIRTR